MDVPHRKDFIYTDQTLLPPRHVRDWSLGWDSRHTIPTIRISPPHHPPARQRNYVEGATRIATVNTSKAPDGGPPDDKTSDICRIKVQTVRKGTQPRPISEPKPRRCNNRQERWQRRSRKEEGKGTGTKRTHEISPWEKDVRWGTG